MVKWIKDGLNGFVPQRIHFEQEMADEKSPKCCKITRISLEDWLIRRIT